MKFLRTHLADERAVALPIALAVLASVAGLSTVAAREAVVTQHQSHRDTSAKRAIQAAQSGLNTATYRTNLLQPGGVQCVIKDATTGELGLAAVLADGWCSPQTETLSDGASYSVRVSTATAVSGAGGQSLLERKIVATGASNSVIRRTVMVMRAAAAPASFPLDYALVTKNSFSITNNALVTGSVASNGDIAISNNATICGNATPGPGKSVSITNNGSMCTPSSTSPAAVPFNFPPVDQGSAATVNDNARITGAKSGTGTPRDTCSSCGSISWNDATRVLQVASNATLTLTGDVYSFCSLTVSNNATLRIAPRTTPLRIYIDSPEECGGGAGMGSVSVLNNGLIQNLNTSPATLQLYVAGSTSVSTTVTIGNNGSSGAGTTLFVYAPNSVVSLTNNVHVTGSVIAKSITFENNTTIVYDESVKSLLSGSPIPIYTQETYKECASEPTGAEPDSGC
jgi:hypothetical protein